MHNCHSFPLAAAISLGLLLSPMAFAATQTTARHSTPHPQSTTGHRSAAAASSKSAQPAKVKSACQASGKSRALVLYKVHTLQHFRTTFWAHGHYIPSGMRQLDHFLRDEHNNKGRRMDPRLIMLLWRIQQQACGRPIGIVSAYRAPTTNKELRKETDEVAKHSMHPLGRAADIRISGWTEPQTYRLARKMHAGGVGFYTQNKFVHVDTGRIRTWSGH